MTDLAKTTAVLFTMQPFILALCRIRKTTLEGCSVSVIGENVDLTYPYNYLGEGAADLGEALKDEKFMQSFKEAKYPVVLVGPGILHRADRDTILQQVSTQEEKYTNSYNF
jgi:hypothetical protein